MSNNFNYYQQAPPQPQPNLNYNYLRFQQQGLKGRPVSSIEEVKASPIDFDGSIFYFPDLANKRIYTKQINLDGTASLNMYELKEIPPETPINTSMYITREEFDAAIGQIQASLLSHKEPEKPAVTPAPNFNF